MRLPGALAPLRHEGFRLLAGGQLASNLGDMFYAVGLPWYVLANHGGPLLLGTVLAAYGIPRTLLVAVGGYASDRFGPWNVMMAADAVRALAIGALAVVAALGPAHAALLIPVAVVLGGAEGLFLPGSMAIIPSLLSGEDLQAGNALSSSGTQLAMLVGPALGGVAVATVGSAPAFGIDAASFVISAVTLAGVRARERAPVPPVADIAALADPHADGADSGGGQLTVGQVLRSARGLQVALAVTVAANLGSGGLAEVALPALARGPFRAGADGYGLLIAMFGGGALLGTILAGQLGSARRPAVVGSLAFLAEAVFMALVPYLGGVLPGAAALLMFGLLNGFGNVTTITVLQRWTPEYLMGRLMGMIMLASFGIFPVSVLLGGIIVHAAGPSVFLRAAAAALALAVGWGLTQSSWRNFGADDATAESDAADSEAAMPDAKVPPREVARLPRIRSVQPAPSRPLGLEQITRGRTSEAPRASARRLPHDRRTTDHALPSTS